MRQIEAWVFDAYGTLLDPFSVQRKAESMFPGRGEALSRLWRSRQLEYTWLRALMNSLRGFLAGHTGGAGLCLPQSGLTLRGNTAR